MDSSLSAGNLFVEVVVLPLHSHLVNKCQHIKGDIPVCRRSTLQDWLLCDYNINNVIWLTFERSWRAKTASLKRWRLYNHIMLHTCKHIPLVVVVATLYHWWIPPEWYYNVIDTTRLTHPPQRLLSLNCIVVHSMAQTAVMEYIPGNNSTMWSSNLVSRSYVTCNVQ